MVILGIAAFACVCLAGSIGVYFYFFPPKPPPPTKAELNLHHRCWESASSPQELDTQFSTFDQSVAANPQDAIAYMNRGSIHYYRGDLDAALADLNKSIGL